MNQHDEARTLRSRSAELAAIADRPDAEGSDGNPAMVLKTITVGTYPTSAQRYYACQVYDVGGAESEGGTPTFTARTGTVYAANLGTAIPPSGTYVLARSVGGRNVFHYNG